MNYYTIYSLQPYLSFSHNRANLILLLFSSTTVPKIYFQVTYAVSLESSMLQKSLTDTKNGFISFVLYNILLFFVWLVTFFNV